MTTNIFDPKLTAQLAAEIASQNPCCTRAEIMEMVTEEIKARNTQHLTGDVERLPGTSFDSEELKNA